MEEKDCTISEHMTFKGRLQNDSSRIQRRVICSLESWTEAHYCHDPSSHQKLGVRIPLMSDKAKVTPHAPQTCRTALQSHCESILLKCFRSIAISLKTSSIILEILVLFLFRLTPLSVSHWPLGPKKTLQSESHSHRLNALPGG